MISKTTRWCRRNTVVASLLGLVFLSMAAGTVVSAIYANSANRQRRHADNARNDAETQRDSANQARKLAEERGDELRRQLYIAHVPRALDEWQNGNAAATKQLLAQHIPEDGEQDLRGFEWHWLDQLTRSARVTIETGRRILAADVSPHGEIIATVGDERLMLHQLDGGEKLFETPVPYAGRYGLGFDSTGKIVAVGHDRVQLWDLESQTPVWEGDDESGNIWVKVTPDNRWVLSASVNWSNGGSAANCCPGLEDGRSCTGSSVFQGHLFCRHQSSRYSSCRRQSRFNDACRGSQDRHSHAAMEVRGSGVCVVVQRGRPLAL